MLKKVLVVAGAILIALALPFVALAITTEEFPDGVTSVDAAADTVQETNEAQATEVAPVEPTGPWVSPNAVDPIATQQSDQTMVRQQLRVHAETGPPEGFDPVQQRLHADDHLGMGQGNGNGGQGQHMGAGHGNGPMSGTGTGECDHDGADCPNGGAGGGHGAGAAGKGPQGNG